jgi:hypothetical protein
MELDLGAMTILQLQQQLLQIIRNEHDHNLSQQIYVSDEVWVMIEHAKNQNIAFVNSMARQLPPDSTALDYAKVLITAYVSNGDTPNELALQALRNEAKQLI